MTAVWILGGVFLLLVLLSRLRLRVSLGYQEDGLRAAFRLGCFRMQLYPETRKKSGKSDTKRVNTETKAKTEEKGTFLTQLLQQRASAWSLLQEALPPVRELMSKFHEKLRVDVLRVHLICALEDPADAALFYGQANAVMGAALPLLERWFTIKRKEIDISLDFERERPQFSAQVQCSLTLGQMMALGAFALTTGWRFYQTHRARKKKHARPQKPLQKTEMKTP